MPVGEQLCAVTGLYHPREKLRNRTGSVTEQRNGFVRQVLISAFQRRDKTEIQRRTITISNLTAEEALNDEED